MFEGQCKSYESGRMICRDGFPVNAACMGVRCFSCGRHTDQIPACQNEDIDARRFLDDRGMPVMNRNFWDLYTLVP